MDEAKKRGRPPKPEDEKRERRVIFLTPPQWAKIDQHGGIEALRRLIDRWRPKQKE